MQSIHELFSLQGKVAIEFGPLGIRVNAIAPGGIATEGVQKMSSAHTQAAAEMKKATEAFLAKIPLRRMGLPDDIATAALFLASNASSYMTGSMLVVDGGVLLS